MSIHPKPNQTCCPSMGPVQTSCSSWGKMCHAVLGYYSLHRITQMDQDLSYFDRRIMLQYINKMLKSYLLMMVRLGKLDLDLL